MRGFLATLSVAAMTALTVPAGQAQSADGVVRAVRDTPCPGIGGTPDIAALADRATRNRLIQANGRLLGEMGNNIAQARRAVDDLRRRQERTRIDSSRQIASTQASIAQAREKLAQAMGFWILARLYDYGTLPASIGPSGQHPLAQIAAHQAALDRAATQSGDPRAAEMAAKFRSCATEAASEYLDMAQADGLPQRARSIREVDALARHLVPPLGPAAESQLRRHSIFAALQAHRTALLRRIPAPAPTRSAQVDRCAQATANARRNLPMVRDFLAAFQRRQLAGTSYLASNAVMTAGGRSIRGRDRIVSAIRQFGGSGRIGAPSAGQCGSISARFSGGRSGTITLALSGNRIQSINIQ